MKDPAPWSFLVKTRNSLRLLQNKTKDSTHLGSFNDSKLSTQQNKKHFLTVCY